MSRGWIHLARTLLTVVCVEMTATLGSPIEQGRKVSEMTLNYYAITLQPNYLVANEVEAEEAAILLEAAHSILLGTPVDLVRVALRHKRALKVFTREDLSRALLSRPVPQPAGRVRSRSELAGRPVDTGDFSVVAGPGRPISFHVRTIAGLPAGA